jgi:hypothetical protein
MLKMSCVPACALCGGRVGTLSINIPHDIWIVENIFIKSYTLDECTYGCMTYSVTAHPDDDQAQQKHVGAAKWENIYTLVRFVGFH